MASILYQLRSKKKDSGLIPFRCNYKTFDLKLVKYIDTDPIDLEDQLQLYVLAHDIHWKLFKLNWFYPRKINMGLLTHIQKIDCIV